MTEGLKMKKLTLRILTFLITCVWQASAQTTILETDKSALNRPPKAPIREVTDTYFDSKVIDPYRWLEDQKNAETAEWMKAQNDYARGFLNHLPMKELFLKRLNELSNANVNISAVRRTGDKYFYFKLAP